MNKLEIKAGSVYGKLTVIGEGEKLIIPCGQVNRTIKCKCECGKIKDIRLLHLKRKRIISCGCSVLTKNGEGNTKLCKVWRQIKARCLESYSENHLYFKKGIAVCYEWNIDYNSFKKWSLENGYKEGLQIDREDNSKGYFPENCRWVTPELNVNNRDCTIIVNYKEKKHSLKLLLKSLGKSESYYTILARIKRGVEHNIAIDKPIRIGNYCKTNFKSKTCRN